MKTLTYHQLFELNPSFMFDPELGLRVANHYQNDKTELSALDILSFEDIPVEDRLQIVLREELIDRNILTEFSCRCVEYMLDKLKIHNEQYTNLINAKRNTISGKSKSKDLLYATAKVENPDEECALAYFIFEAVLSLSSVYVDKSAKDTSYSVMTAFVAAASSELKKEDFVSVCRSAKKQEYERQIEELKKMLEE